MFLHPLHPIFVHFTIALTITSIFCYFLAQLPLAQKIRHDLFAASFWMFLFSALITLGTVTTGYLQFISVAHDKISHMAMVSHRYWALATASLLFLLSVWFIVKYKRGDHKGKFFSALLLVLLICILTTAYKGGNLVFKYGLGVESTPAMREVPAEDYKHE